MNRKQKRKKISQKKAFQKNVKRLRKPPRKILTRKDVVDNIKMFESFSSLDQRQLDYYLSKASAQKNLGWIALIVLGLIDFLWLFLCDFSFDGRTIPVVAGSVCLILIPWSGFLIYKDNLPLWEEQFHRNEQSVKKWKKFLCDVDSGKVKLAK